MGNVTSWKPWAVFFKAAPTEEQLLHAECKALLRRRTAAAEALEQATADLEYCRHKLRFFDNTGE